MKAQRFFSIVVWMAWTAQAFLTRTTMTKPRHSVLHERQWNFNEGQGPWGLKRNAEIWNGRVAQMAFVEVVLQELIQGKGVIQGLQEGDPINYICAGAFGIFLLGFTGFLALKGEDDYVGSYLDELKANKR